jgi:hypothetical protein
MVESAKCLSKSLTKEIIVSGLFVGTLEPCIEDAILFSGKGLVSLSSLPFLFWIGAVELVGLGQILLLFRFFKNGDRLKAGLILWLLTIPAILSFFAIGAFLASHIRLLNIWGPITLSLVAALVAGVPAYFPHTKIPLAYFSLAVGLIVDLTLSLNISGHSFTTLTVRSSEVLLASALIVIIMGIALILVSYISDCIYITTRTNQGKKRLERKLKCVALLYLLTMAGFMTGFIPAYSPVLILAIGLLFVIFSLKKTSQIEWRTYHLALVKRTKAHMCALLGSFTKKEKKWKY